MPALPKLPILLTALILCASMIAAAEKPNLIYILLDDAGYGDLSCYGQTKFETPQIDRLASEGLKFTQHYSGSTVCAPTRCVLMTGKHTGHAHVRGNREIQPEGQAPMPADIVTLPRLLSEAGYRTGCFGKWGLGAPGSPSDPMEHFDAFFGYNCQREAHTYYPTHLWRDREKIPWDGKTHTHPPTMDAANEFIRESAEGPFFLFLAITIPHAAMHCPEEHVAPWRKEFPEFEGVIGKYGKHAEVDNPVAAFAGMMTLLDDTIGDLLNTLDAAGIDENTLVVFSSDNGPHKEGGHQPDLFDSNGPLRGYKRDLSEGGIRVPMLARWPGTIAPGRESEHISAHWDILPTFCELAGVESPGDVDGISFVPTLRGADGQVEHEYLYWEFYERGGRKAARWGQWKAIQDGITKDPDAPVEIYDLEADIGEETDLAAQKPELVERAHEIFSDAHTPSPLWSFSKKKGGGGEKKP